MRPFASIALIIIAFCGTIGIPFYRHTCLHDKVTIETLFVASDHCDDGHETHAVVPNDCCAETPSESISDGCCSENVSMFTLNFGFIEHIATQLPAIIPGEILIGNYLRAFVSPVTDELILTAANTDPPSPEGREILNRICILRL